MAVTTPTTPSPSPSPSAPTALGRAIPPRVARHPGRSGFHTLRHADGAFAARMLLARSAERCLDVQYYLWHLDLTGTLLFDALREAADRGVTVRLLLDDNNTSGLDPVLAALGAHPNFEVRLFNAFRVRRPRWLGFLLDFSRANRRMHNKSFTADRQVTVVGGRNVGDEYFGATDGVLFSDLDVMAVGPVVSEVANAFERYWNAAAVRPVGSVLPPADPAVLETLTRSAARMPQKPGARAYLDALRDCDFVEDLLDGELELEWAHATVVCDDPAKADGDAPPGEVLPITRLNDVIDVAVRSVDIVSPYFVPMTDGTARLVALARRGVRVRILTNSLAATDVSAVHAGYAKRRRALLEAGVVLYELKHGGDADDPPRRHRVLGGSSRASLHAKTFSVDAKRLFVGSLNFDPRSARLNTEMGFVIESEVLAERAQHAFDELIPQRAYRVELARHGRLEWLDVERPGQTQRRHACEPDTTWWLRAWVRVLAWLPIEWLL